MAYGSSRSPALALLLFLSITGGKNPYRKPFSEFQSHFVYGGMEGVGGGGGKVAGGGGWAGSGRSSS